MLDSFRRGQRWLTIAVVAFIGGVFVFFMGVGGGLQPAGPAGNAVVQLGDVRMQVADYYRVRAQQEAGFRERLGDQFDARQMSGFLDSQALQMLVDSVVMADSAHELGLQVSKEEVQRLVRSSPAFRDEQGRFDREAFASYANYEFGSQRVFLEVMRMDLLRQKMIGLLYAQASVSESEARDAALYGLESVRVAYVTLETGRLPEGEVLEDAAVQSYLAAHRDELQAGYDAEIQRWTLPEQVHARHILIRVTSTGQDEDEASIEEARARATAARDRIVAGESFEEVAKELSEDPGSRESGGDLGTFARGVNAPALETAAFALEPGDLSDLIQSEFGFHVVKVEAREPARTRPFDEVGPELARKDAEAEAAESKAREAADALVAAIGAGQSLEEAARERDLDLERTAALRRRPDGFVPGLGAAPELLAAVFALSPDSASSQELFEVGSQLVLVQLLEREMPDEETLASAVDAQREGLLNAKRNRLIQDWVDRRKQALEESGQLLVNASLVISDT